MISVTLYRRPDYTVECLRALSRCRGIDRHPVLISIDNSPSFSGYQCESVARDILPEARLVLHKNKIGCSSNIVSGIHSAFRNFPGDLCIVVEDDVILAEDAIEYFEWCHRELKDDPSVLSYSAFREEDGETDPCGVKLVKWFTPWGWAIDRKRWEDIEDDLWSETVGDKVWDGVMNHQVRGDRSQAMPLVSRSDNIGEKNGTHRGAARAKLVPPGKYDYRLVGRYAGAV